MGQAAFLCRTGENVALNGAADGGAAALAGLPQNAEKVLQQTVIPAAVTAYGDLGANHPLFGFVRLIGGEGDDLQQVVPVMAADLASFTHDLNGSAHPVRKAGKVEADGDIVVETDQGYLVVTDIVVTVKDAAPVGTGLQGLAQSGLTLVLANHCGGPGAPDGKVGPIGAVVAAVPAGTVTAAKSCAFRGVFWTEVPQVAEGYDLLCLTVCQPGHQVHVVAGFLQDHRTGLVGSAPVAADKTVGNVEIANVLVVLNGNDFSQLSGVQNLLQSGIEGRVAQHMANHDFAAKPLCLFGDGHTFQRVRRDGLFQQNVVA